jgi:UDP:flavonoid glycosyltransferase YjiC (YdhE family)
VPDTEPLRVLFVAFSRSSLGHIVRSTAAAARFLARGHDVLLACSEEAARVPKDAGVPWAGVDEIAPAPVWRKIQSDEEMRALARTRLASPGYLGRCLEQESALIDRYRPDVVVSDMRNTAGVAAAMAGVPSAALHNLRLFISPMNVILPEVLAALNELGVPETHARRALGDVLVVPDLSLFEPLWVVPPGVRPLVYELPREIRYVGPLLMREPGDLPPRHLLRERYGAAGRLLISVTLGGSAGGEDHICDIVDGLAGLDADLVVTSGPGITGERVGPAIARYRSAVPGARVTVEEYRSDALELMRACDVAVVHGGHGTTLEGMFCGTPMVFVPHVREQHENADRAVRLGVGVTVEPADVRDRLKDLVLACCEPAVRRRCAGLGARLSLVRGGDSLASFVESQLVATAGSR